MGLRVLIDEDEFEVAIDEGSRYRTVYVRESEEGHRARIVRDPRAAASWIRAQASGGSVEAQVAWGHVLLAGHGVEQDMPAAVLWFQTAARAGNSDALNMLGRCCEHGWGVARDAAKAARWYRTAADKGHAWAEFNLASLVAQGNGVEQSFPEALVLLVRSARRGNAKAMNMIGRFREDGLVRRAKLKSAARWYRWAAERGCFRGQFHHARFLAAAGRTDEAVDWIKRSLAHAPSDFRADAAEMLRRHPVAAIRQIGLEALKGKEPQA